MTKKSFSDIFADTLGTLALLLDYELSEKKIAAYLKLLTGKGYAQADILAAIDQASETCKFFPKPAEIIELITGGKGGGQDPTVAWREVLDALEIYGSYRDVEFKDGAIAAAIDGLGGWPALGAMTYEDMTYQKIAAQFAKLYSEAVRVGAHKRPGLVVGRDSIANNSNGYQVDALPAQARTVKELAEVASARAEEAKKRPAELPAPVASIEDQEIAMEIVKKFTERQMLQNPIPGAALRQREEDWAQKEAFRQQHNSERAES